MLTKDTYQHITEEHNLHAASEIVPFLVKILGPQSVLDVGCGIGTWLWEFKQAGVKTVKGIDNPYVDKKLLTQYLQEQEFLAYDLSKPFDFNEKFDLVISLEVAEHLPASSAEIFVDSLTKHSDIILFSAAVPFQDGQNHINEQWPEYWYSFFEKKGYVPYDFVRDKFWHNSNVDIWYRQNILLYAKPNLPKLQSFSPATGRLSRVHPELFELRMKKLKKARLLIEEHIAKPTVKHSFKILVKSLVQTLKPRFDSAKKS
ncbi:MAG: class I SAM-dependent methyltransferase [Chitinophagaceae bacterium]|nr:class I SAM-dependent methyltransferase [Chitinophagaceae bacterium]